MKPASQTGGNGGRQKRSEASLSRRHRLSESSGRKLDSFIPGKICKMISSMEVTVALVNVLFKGEKIDI